MLKKIDHNQFVLIFVALITGFWAVFAKSLIWLHDPQVERFIVFGITSLILLLSYLNNNIHKNLETVNLFLLSILMGHFLTIVYRSQNGGLVIFYSYLLGAATALMALAFAFKSNSHQRIIVWVVFVELVILIISIESKIMPKAVGINIFAVFSAFYINYKKNQTLDILETERGNLKLLLESSVDKYLIFTEKNELIYKDNLITPAVLDKIKKKKDKDTLIIAGVEYELEFIKNKNYNIVYFKNYSSIKSHALKISQILYQNQSLLEIKRITSCISHEINNPLSAIELSVDILQDKNKDSIEIDVIKSSIAKIQNLSSDLSKFNEEFTGVFELISYDYIKNKFLGSGFSVNGSSTMTDVLFNKELIDMLVNGLSMILEDKDITLIIKENNIEIVLFDKKIKNSDDIFRPFNFKKDNIQNNNRFSMSLTKDKINKSGFNIIFFEIERKIIIAPKI